MLVAISSVHMMLVLASAEGVIQIIDARTGTMKKTFTLTSHINQTNRQTEGETASSDYSSVLTAYQRILQQDSHSEMDRNLLRNLGFLYGQAIKNSSELILQPVKH